MNIKKIVLHVFKSEVFPLQPTEGTGNPGMSARIAKVFHRFSLKKLTPKQMLQILQIALAQIKTGNHLKTY